MINAEPKNRTFLFLQGPHGPYFQSLAKMIAKSGARCFRIGFNAGDAFFWSDKNNYIPFTDPRENWPQFFQETLDAKSITDIVLYGDTREIHAQAVEIARSRGLTIHVFEEGYLRPYWVTYEREGANGNSRLMKMSIDDMRKSLRNTDMETPLPPSHWGDMRHHIFYGALYHWFVMFANRRYPNFKPHRSIGVAKEFRLYLRRLLLMPYNSAQRWRKTQRIRNAGFPYHLVLLQLEHDASFQTHSPFSSMTEFLELVIENFVSGAPSHHHLVFKAHPLEDGRAPISKTLTTLAKKHGIEDRVHYVRGGKLALLLNDARTAVTVNSTAGQQVLWRGIPIKVMGRSVYDKPELVAQQPLSKFFQEALRPEANAYGVYRRFLLETSQVSGGFYSHKGRQRLLRLIVDMMLSPEDPYEALQSGTAAPRQHLRIVN